MEGVLEKGGQPEYVGVHMCPSKRVNFRNRYFLSQESLYDYLKELPHTLVVA